MMLTCLLLYLNVNTRAYDANLSVGVFGMVQFKTAAELY